MVYMYIYYKGLLFVTWNHIIACKLLVFDRNTWNYISDYKIGIVTLNYISKVGDLSRGWPKGSLFNSYYTEV